MSCPNGLASRREFSTWALAAQFRRIALKLVEFKFVRKSTQVFHRLATQRKSTQVDRKSSVSCILFIRLFATCVNFRADLAIRLAIHRNSVQFLFLPTRCWLASTWDPVWPGLKQTRTVNDNVGRRSKYFFVIFVSIPSFWFNTLFVSILSETQLPSASSSSWTKQYIDTRSCKVDDISIKTAWMEMEQFKSLTRIARHRSQLYLRILSCVNKSLILLCWRCCRRPLLFCLSSLKERTLSKLSWLQNLDSQSHLFLVKGARSG